MTKKLNTVRIEGVIEEALPGLLFRVKVENPSGKQILAHLGGKLKINRIRVIPGDRVLLEMANLNDDRARIIKRF
jgi:translation initiation factor IF-1